MTHAQERTPLTHGIDLESMQRSREARTGTLPIALDVEGLNLFYGEKQALKNISLSIAQKKITAFIGPSGCGKSTLLRCFNRMNDLIDGCRIEGAIRLY